MLFEDVENIFLDDIRNKKKETTSKILATKFKRKSNVLFPSDTMSRKDKLKHTKAGKVMTSNIFDTILTLEEFEKLETHEQRNRLAYWRTKYDNKTICSTMGIWNNKYYKIVSQLGLPKAPRTDSDESKEQAKAKRKYNRKASVAINAPEAPEQVQIQSELEFDTQVSPVQEIIVNGLHLVYNGTFNSEQIIKQMLKFGALLEGEENDFYIELKLVEKAPKE